MDGSKIPEWAKKFVTEFAAQSIEQKVAEVESRTSAEIIPVFARSSSTTGHVFPMLVLTGILFAFMVQRYLEFDDLIFTFLALGLLAIAFIFSRLDFFKRALTAKEDQIVQVNDRAELAFYELGLTNTEGKTGILIFISLLERRVVILGDEAINHKVPKDFWQKELDKVVSGVKSGKIVEGFHGVLDDCSQILEKEFPIQPSDKNELKDHLVFLD